jgi:hypothetical protein
MNASWRYIGLIALVATLIAPNQAEAVQRGDTIEVSGGYGLLNVYGQGIETKSLPSSYVVGRYVKDLNGGWGIAAEYLVGLGTGFSGFSIGANYDLSPLFFTDSGSDVTFDDGSLIERHSLWRVTYSGVVNTTGDTRIPKRAISANVYGIHVGTVLEHMLTKNFAFHLATFWIAGFAADFGAQQVSVAAGLGWVGI